MSMSRVIASGRKAWASRTPVSPSSATSPLKPCSRAMSSSTRAKIASFSTTSTVRSPVPIVSRSSGICGAGTSAGAASSTSATAGAASAASAGDATSPESAVVRRPKGDGREAAVTLADSAGAS